MEPHRYNGAGELDPAGEWVRYDEHLIAMADLRSGIGAVGVNLRQLVAQYDQRIHEMDQANSNLRHQYYEAQRRLELMNKQLRERNSTPPFKKRKDDLSGA